MPIARSRQCPPWLCPPVAFARTQSEAHCKMVQLYACGFRITHMRRSMTNAAANFAAHLPLHPERYSTDRAQTCDGAGNSFRRQVTKKEGCSLSPCQTCYLSGPHRTGAAPASCTGRAYALSPAQAVHASTATRDLLASVIRSESGPARRG
jgi:hypothetical protein